jgi:hypothetical protein
MKLAGFCRTSTAALILVGLMVIAPACAAPRGRLYVRLGPPEPLYETRIVAPGPGYVWVPGYHVWNGAAYGWRPGIWVVAPRARAEWVPGHWQRDRRGWYFVEGHWR